MTILTYENFDLLITRAPGGYQARVLNSPVSEAVRDFAAPFTEAELAALPGYFDRSAGDLPLPSPELLGETLYRVALADQVGASLRRSLDEATRRGLGLRIRLRLDKTAPELADWPWEYLRAPDRPDPFALSITTPIVRYIELTEPAKPLVSNLPLRVLAVTASPGNLRPLDIEQEWARLQRALKPLSERRLIVLERLESATLALLQARLRGDPVHLLHFIGHGFFDQAANVGGLVFEDGEGGSDIVTASALGLLLHDHEPLRLVFLNACEAGRGGRRDPFAGVAQRLVQGGVPAVAAMQFPITDRAALILSQEFYRALADGLPADAALSEARKAIKLAGDDPAWGTPVLFSRSGDNRLIAPETAKARPGALGAPPEPQQPPGVAGFVGREQELAHFAARLAADHVAVIAGMAGVGKTVLAARLARQVAADPSRIFWHQFHEGEGIETIIWRLAGMLYRHGQMALWELLEGARQSGGQPPPAEVLLDYLVQLLRGQDYVLCLDDFHYADGDPLVEKAVERLQILLSTGEVSLIVTSRRLPTVFRDQAFAPLGGLRMEDTRALLSTRSVALTPELLAELHHHTDGNAELLTLAVHALQRSRQPAQVIKRLADEDDIETYLLQEVDRGLTTDEKLVLGGVAALLGYPGTRSAIETTLASGNLKRTLRYLANRFLLREQEGRLDHEYLTHAIVQTFYYELLSRQERQALHRRAGEYYEQEEPDALKAALHYQRAGEAERAARLATADIWAAINQGQARLLRSLLLLLSQAQLAAAASIQVQLALGEVLAFLDETEAAQAAYQAALTALHAQAATPAARAGTARACLGLGTLLANRDPETALGWIERGLAAVDAEESDLTTALYNRKGTILLGQATYGEAIAALEQALALLPPAPSQLRGAVLNNLGSAWAWAGDSARGSQYTGEAVQVSTALHDTITLLSLISNIAIDKEIGGDWAGAGADYGEALRLAEQLGSLSEQARIHSLLGILRLHQGAESAAEEHLQRAVSLSRQIRSPEHLATTLPVLAQLHIGRHAWAPARAALAEAETLATEHGWDYILPETYASLALLALGQDQPDEALAQAEHSVVSAQQLAATVEEGKGLRVKGQALARLGRPHEAAAALEASLALLADADPYEAAQTQRCLAQLSESTGEHARSLGLLNQADAAFRQLGLEPPPR